MIFASISDIAVVVPRSCRVSRRAIRRDPARPVPETAATNEGDQQRPLDVFSDAGGDQEIVQHQPRERRLFKRIFAQLTFLSNSL